VERSGRIALILVTDPRWDDAHIVQVARAAVSIAGFSVQLRDRTERTDDDLVALASTLREITARAHGVFIVNRRLDLARRVNADGFHAPSSELAEARDFKWRSAPVHDERELRDARDHGATAVFVSPIFTSPNKGPARGTDALRRARADGPNLTIVALGGIDQTNVNACFEAGADVVAVMRALLDAPDPAHVAKCLSRT